uniref:Uncharacterized protein n=1 Tax=Vespula pensylvanica TaxID=30213 RepID=A0A834NAC4_VESPE|nr:hypothetical protein H0235_015353 [Vespula pensylvanica]
MEEPHPGGTAFMITVTSAPGNREDRLSVPRVRKLLSSLLEIDCQSPPRVRKFLSPVVETDCQSPPRVRKRLSPVVEIDCQSPQKVRKCLSLVVEIDFQSSRSAKTSKSSREDRLSMSPEGMRKCPSPVVEIDFQSSRNAETSKSSRGDRLSKSPEDAKISKSIPGGRLIFYLRKLFVTAQSHDILRKFLSPVVEIDCQRPSKISKSSRGDRLARSF